MLRRYDVNQSTADGILVFLEVERDGENAKLSDVGAELLGKAKSICDGRLFAVAFGGLELKPLYPEIFGYGVHTLYHVRDRRLETYMPEAYAEVICAIIERIGPAVVLFGATPIGRELAPRVAASLGRGLTADCTELRADGRVMTATRPAFGGTLMADIDCVGFPQLATVRPGTFPRPEKRSGQGTAIYWQYDGSSIKDIISEEAGAERGADIKDARILISLGDGVRDRSLIEVAESVARKVGAQVSCSRALVEKGWMPRSRQVGMSGRTVAPELYIAFGISGAVQHRTGMMGSKRVIAVNKDPDAPIHDFADLSLLADAGDILRELDRSLRLRDARHRAREDLVDVAGDLDVAPGRLHGAVPPDDERRADGADGLLAVGHLGAPGADLLHELVLGVAQQLDALQLLAVYELPVGRHGVLAHPYYGDVAEHELRVARAEVLGLGGAAGRVVPRVEVDHVPDALQGPAVQPLAVLVHQPEFRELVSYVHLNRLGTGCPSCSLLSAPGRSRRSRRGG